MFVAQVTKAITSHKANIFMMLSTITCTRMLCHLRGNLMSTQKWLPVYHCPELLATTGLHVSVALLIQAILQESSYIIYSFVSGSFLFSRFIRCIMHSIPFVWMIRAWTWTMPFRLMNCPLQAYEFLNACPPAAGGVVKDLEHLQCRTWLVEVGQMG